MDLYVPSSPCASRKLVTVAFPTLRHHILLLLLLLLLSKRPSALLKLSKGIIFTPIASTSARGVHRHQAILTLSLYNTKRIHIAFCHAISFASHAFARTRSSRYARTVYRARSGAETVMSCLLSYLGTINRHKTLVLACMNTTLATGWVCQ